MCYWVVIVQHLRFSLVAATILALASPVRGSDFNRAVDAYFEADAAGDYEEALRHAITAYRIAVSRMQDDPNLVRQMHQTWVRHTRTLVDTKRQSPFSFMHCPGEKRLGKNHRKTLTAALNLGSVCNNLGRYDEAEKYYRRVIDAPPNSGTKEQATLAKASFIILRTNVARKNGIPKAKRYCNGRL